MGTYHDYKGNKKEVGEILERLNVTINMIASMAAQFEHRHLVTDSEVDARLAAVCREGVGEFRAAFRNLSQTEDLLAEAMQQNKRSFWQRTGIFRRKAS